MNEPSAESHRIQPHHLERSAYVYVRQSSLRQVAEHLRLVHPPCAGCSGSNASSISTSSAVRCVAVRCVSSRASTRPRSSRESSLISPCAKPTASTTPAHHRCAPAAELPVSDRALTAPTGAPRPHCASPPNPPGSPPSCHARVAAELESHQLDRTNFRARTGNEPDNDHTNNPTATQIGRLFHLSFVVLSGAMHEVALGRRPGRECDSNSRLRVGLKASVRTRPAVGRRALRTVHVDHAGNAASQLVGGAEQRFLVDPTLAQTREAQDPRFQQRVRAAVLDGRHAVAVQKARSSLPARTVAASIP